MSEEFLVPPALEPGDEVAVVAPASGSAASAPHVRDLGVERLRETFDLEPVVYPTAEKDDEYLDAHPEARARDLHDAFRDPEVRGIVATIGGDDQLRVLKHLDPDVLRENPTRFYGMSDNTNVELFLWNYGIVSYYGGQLMNQISTPGSLHEYTERYLRRAFFEESLGELEPANEWTDDVVDWEAENYPEHEPEYELNPGWTWRGGEEHAAGRLWGGCLAIVEMQLMTERYLPAPDALDGAVLVIETDETLPRADYVKWTLMCMGERGLLERFDAVLVGRPATRSHLERPGDDERRAYRERQREAIAGQLERYNPNIPVVFDLDFGHTNPTAPLPIGGRVAVDPTAERIVFE
jgi:muramoyltetrapeptide carboxypeptidase LdcA involved in peptidoglycan recycling